MNSPYVENIFPETIHDHSAEFTYPKTRVTYQAFPFPLNNKLNRVIKRFFDIIISIIVIGLFLLWVIPLFAILIKLDSCGPIFLNKKETGTKKRYLPVSNSGQ